ncbi:hypothetical protein SAMN05421504_1011340 [Amycolatopsis xylanica]|uniref:Uncharacterized protein n=1 Tax=Amycolatopsis xylanica TaxID=589385 RepID=A0A1H2VVL4_9PSEU|nr:hypothetical protein [Amycolatopsis xylanica]SDW72277.1 hypothetical protein SAMN05421504_1011340 [Amycolatopsis xylanica]
MSLDELTTRVAGILPHPVDELQVAALLESQGLTDQGAADDYGMADVFAVAVLVFDRLRDRPAPAPAPEEPPETRNWTEIVRGPLYALPAMVYPAVSMAMDETRIVPAMVFTTALGWIWGAGTSWVAYRLLGQGLEKAAGKAQRVLGGVGLVLVLVGSMLLTPGWLVLFAVVQMIFQLAVGTLVFYRDENRLAIAMTPACVAGIAHLMSGYDEGLTIPTLVCAVVSVLLAGFAALRATFTGTGALRMPRWRPLAIGAAPSMVYAALCAGLLLYTDTRYVVARIDLAVGVAPLVLGMGAVEWRAHRFFEQAGELVRGSILPAQFGREVWRVLLRELGACLILLALCGLPVLALLAYHGVLSRSGALLIDGHLMLGGAFFLGFVLARVSVPALLAVWGGVLFVYIGLAEVLNGGHVPLLLVSATGLVALMLMALRTSVGQVRHYG